MRGPTNGNMIAVEVQSDSWSIDGQTLYYIRNGQGNIMGLIDSSGRTAIEYRYDTWGRTKDSLMVEWESHMKYLLFPSAQDVDFDREEEGFTAEDYHDKALSRLKSIIEGFLIRGM